MKLYYIKTDTFGSDKPVLIDEEIMLQAEQGMNYLNPDDYMFFCEADCLADAKEFYWEEFSRIANDRVAEKYHY